MKHKTLLLLFSWWVVSNSLWPHGLQHPRLPSFIISWSLLKFTEFIESAMLSNHLILCCSLLLLLSIFPSIRVFFNELALCIRWPNYCNLSFSISPSSEYSGLISFRIDWFDLLAAQGTLILIQWALIQYDWCSYKKRQLGHRRKTKMLWVLQGEESHLQTIERGLRRGHLYWHLDLGLLVSRAVRKQICLLKPPSLWYFVMATIAN